MPRRIIELYTDGYFHVFNRGVAKADIFRTQRDYHRFINTLRYYQYDKHSVRYSVYMNLSQNQQFSYLQNLKNKQKLVLLINFALMPNHYHFLLRQETDKGISKFISLISNSYTRYFNIKHNRVGHLFQGAFKAVHIEDDAQLLQVSRYIHRNPVEASLIPINSIHKFPWSSLASMANPNLDHGLVYTKPILEHFRNFGDYMNFLLDSSDILTFFLKKATCP